MSLNYRQMSIAMLTIEQNTRQLEKRLTSFLKDKKAIKEKQHVTMEVFLEDKMLMISAIRSGIPFPLFDLIQVQSPFSEDEWASLLDISTKSLQRYRQSSKPFKTLQSERIIEMAEVTSLGMDVFGNVDKFRQWLHVPNFAMGNTKPIELLRDSYGKELVVGELTRINHGIFI